MTAKASDILAGPPARPGLGGRVTWIVCAQCTATGLLSSRGLFQVLNWGAVRRHIAAAKPCRVADMGSDREIQVEARPGDVLAWPAGEARRDPPARRTSDTRRQVTRPWNSAQSQ